MSNAHFVKLPIGIHVLDLTATQFRVLLAMASHANWQSGKLRVRQETLATEVGCSRESVSRAIARLTEFSLVKTLRTGRSSVFQIMLDWTPDGHISCDEPSTSDVTNSSHLQNESDSNENDSNNSSLSHSTTSADQTSDEIQAESAQKLLERELGAEMIEEIPTLRASGGAEAESDKPVTTNSVGRSGLPRDVAAEKFNPGNFNPKQAAAEHEALERKLDEVTPEWRGQTVSAEKMSALAKAGTAKPFPFPVSFDPVVVGYTEQMFKQEFSLLDFGETVNGFVAHHMSKGDVSKNWLGKFLTYAQVGQRQRQESKRDDHEPAVNKAATWDAKRKKMWREQCAATGEGYAAWQARMEREGVTLP